MSTKSAIVFTQSYQSHTNYHFVDFYLSFLKTVFPIINNFVNQSELWFFISDLIKSDQTFFHFLFFILITETINKRKGFNFFISMYIFSDSSLRNRFSLSQTIQERFAIRITKV